MRGKVGARDAKGGDELRGTARKKVFAKGRFWDVKMYAIVKEDG